MTYQAPKTCSTYPWPTFLFLCPPRSHPASWLFMKHQGCSCFCTCCPLPVTLPPDILTLPPSSSGKSLFKGCLLGGTFPEHSCGGKKKKTATPLPAHPAPPLLPFCFVFFSGVLFSLEHSTESTSLFIFLCCPLAHKTRQSFCLVCSLMGRPQYPEPCMARDR